MRSRCSIGKQRDCLVDFSLCTKCERGTHGNSLGTRGCREVHSVESCQPFGVVHRRECGSILGGRHVIDGVISC